MGEYGAFYGTIGFQLTQLAEGLKGHSYAIVPESFYRGWKRLGSFKEEKDGSYYGTDYNEHQVTTAKFEDEGHTWLVTTAICAHPSDPKEFCWRYIVKITKNGEVVSRPRTRFEDYLQYIARL